MKKDTKAGIRELEKRLNSGEPMSDEERVEALRVLGLGVPAQKLQAQSTPSADPDYGLIPQYGVSETSMMPQPSKRQQKIIDTALQLQEQSAAESDDIGYMARAVVLATLPHSKKSGNEFTRINGTFRLAIWSPAGLPYGSLPRLLLAWMTTEAVRTRSKDLELGQSLTEFMTSLGEIPTGGRWGSITRLRNQTERLFSSSIVCTYNSEEGRAAKHLRVASEYEIWWFKDQRAYPNPRQKTIWISHVRLDEQFFQEIIERPVPIDLRVVHALKKSPLALDIYCWLTYRMSYLRGPTIVPWPYLETQFGADYKRRRAFREHFKQQMQVVLTLYPVNVYSVDDGLELRSGHAHISKRAFPVHKPNI